MWGRSFSFFAPIVSITSRSAPGIHSAQWTRHQIHGRATHITLICSELTTLSRHSYVSVAETRTSPNKTMVSSISTKVRSHEGHRASLSVLYRDACRTGALLRNDGDHACRVQGDVFVQPHFGSRRRERPLMRILHRLKDYGPLASWR